MLLGLMPELTATRTGPILAERLPALRRVIYLGTDAQPGGIAWADFLDLGNRIAARELEARETTLQFDDPINIQYTSGTTGSPKGATLSHHNILNNGYFVGEVLRYTEHDRICAAGPVLSLLRLRAGQPGGRHAWQRRRHPWRVVRSGRHAAGDRGGAVHVHLRRADDVHRAAGPSPLRQRPARHAAHGHHGRRSVSDRRHASGHRPHARAAGHDLLRHDRNVARVVPVRGSTIRSSFACRRSAACCRTSNARSSTRTPARPFRAARQGSCARAATPSCSATGTMPRRPPPRSTRRAGCTPATSPS